jgi:hypothetical protein
VARLLERGPGEEPVRAEGASAVDEDERPSLGLRRRYRRGEIVDDAITKLVAEGFPGRGRIAADDEDLLRRLERERRARRRGGTRARAAARLAASSVSRRARCASADGSTVVRIRTRSQSSCESTRRSA